MAIPCPVAGPAASGLCRLTTRSVAAGSEPGSGSLHTAAPAGRVTVGAPPKVSRRLLPRRSSAPCLRRPAWTLSKVIGRSPNALDSRTLTPVPPTLVCTTSRWLRPATPVPRASALAAQVATSRGAVSARAGGAAQTSTASRAAAAGTAPLTGRARRS